MAKHLVAIDIGSTYISGALVSDGCVITIPSVVAVSADGRQLHDVGLSALRLAQVDNSVVLTNPILEGAICDTSLAKHLLTQLLDRVVPNKSLAQISVVCSLPCAMISTDKHDIEVLLLSLGVRDVSFVEAPLCVATEAFSQFKTNRGIMVDIGSDCTDLAIVVGDSIVNGCTLYHAGKALTQMLSARIENKYLVSLELEQVEKLQHGIVSLYPNDNANATISGINKQTGTIDSINISSKEMYDAVTDYVRAFCTVVDSLLVSCPDQVAHAVRQEGVMLCGGGASLVGIDYFMHNECNLPVRVIKDNRMATINGLVKYCKAKFI